MTMTRMACNVYVLTEGGESLLLEAGDTPPEWALPQLGEHTLEPEGAPEGDEDESTEEEGDEGEDTPDAPTIPPIKGRGSSAKAWAEYALSQGFEVEPDAKASEIRDALAEAGVPVE